MDPELSRLFGGAERMMTLSVSMLIHGATVMGSPSHPKRWGEDVNAIVEAEQKKPGIDDLAMAFLMEVPKHEDDFEGGYATLRDVTVLLANGVSFRVAFLRIDLEHVAAWWLRPPEPPPDLQPTN
jgi:hypothetical protein